MRIIYNRCPMKIKTAEYTAAGEGVSIVFFVSFYTYTYKSVIDPNRVPPPLTVKLKILIGSLSSFRVFHARTIKEERYLVIIAGNYSITATKCSEFFLLTYFAIICSLALLDLLLICYTSQNFKYFRESKE